MASTAVCDVSIASVYLGESSAIQPRHNRRGFPK
jgi:hypothetical protein